MSNIEFILRLTDSKIIIKMLESFFIILFTFYTYIRVLNIKKINRKIIVMAVFSSIIIAIIARTAEYVTDVYIFFIVKIFLIGIITNIVFKKELSYSLLVTMISLTINYIFYIIAVAITFVPNALIKIFNEYINLIFIVLIYYLIINRFFKIKKFKYGIAFLIKRAEDTYFNTIILTIVSMVLFLLITFKSYIGLDFAESGTNFLIFAILMLIIIKQLIQSYYKQNLLEKDLKETKEELEAKKKEVEKLEKENLEFSKTSHSLAHKQKALEYRLSQLTKLGKINEDEEIDIKNELENISEEMYKEPEDIELAKTDIPSIDNMFSYMQSECIKDNIKFELQVVGNIHYMVNNLITENELEILIADHIKDAIIAINHSDNSNRSIFVRIGKIDNVYSLYIYDSGIEFTKEVLDNLGKKPITTHADTGGTGMGFMNTFDTLNKTKASLIINEIGKPCEDNYTKVLIFKFDNQNEFKLNSYKNEVVV